MGKKRGRVMSLYVYAGQWKRAHKLAKDRGISLSELVRQLIDAELARAGG